MADTNVPTITFGDRGFVVPSGPAVLAGVQADINASFGSTLNFALNTPQGQLASSEAAIIVNANSIFLYYSQQVDPAYASGRFQDAIGRIYFLERNPSEPTSLQIVCSGLSGVPIPVNALVSDSSGNLYGSTDAGTIGVGGTVTLGFAALVPGPTTVPETVSIYQAIQGWDSAIVSSGTQGVDVETRAAFEQRRQDTVAGNSFGAAGSIIGAVAKVPGVLDYYGRDNPSNAPITIGGVTIAANSIYICVAGGSQSDVAQAILSKKGPGCSMTGNTTVTTYDSNPLYTSPIPYQITYQIPSSLQFLVKVVIVNGPTVPSDAAVQVQNALVSAFGGADGGPRVRIGSTAYATRFVPPVAALGSWAQVSLLQIGSANTPDAVFTGRISGNTLTVSAVTTGSIAVNQTLSDTTGIIINATSIAALGTGSGGTGTYIVNNPQTVGGTTFTATGSGASFTATGVTGQIVIGDLVSGTGVPAGTIILSQISGTVGGSGVYTTNHVVTSSGAVLTTSEIISASSADQTVVVVDIDQEPQLVPANIAVSLT